jgi:hypothetical protein
MVARNELRRSWASLLAVGLLVAIVSTVVLAALVGAQRTSTSVERFREWAHASDGSFQSDLPERADAMLAAALATPEVETATLRILLNIFPADGTTPDLAIMSDPTGIYGVSLDRPLILHGRLPRADAPDEILLNELAARITGLGVGDVIEANTWSTDDLEAMFEGPDFPGFNGPTLQLRVVGVGRTPEELTGDVRRTAPFAIGSPSFLDAHPDLGAWPPAVVVRTHGDGAGLEAVSEAITEVRDLTDPVEGPGAFYPDATTAAEVYLDTSRSTVNSLAVGLLAFAAASGLAGGLAGRWSSRRCSRWAWPSGPRWIRACGWHPGSLRPGPCPLSWCSRVGRSSLPVVGSRTPRPPWRDDRRRWRGSRPASAPDRRSPPGSAWRATGGGDPEPSRSDPRWLVSRSQWPACWRPASSP